MVPILWLDRGWPEGRPDGSRRSITGSRVGDATPSAVTAAGGVERGSSPGSGSSEAEGRRVVLRLVEHDLGPAGNLELNGPAECWVHTSTRRRRLRSKHGKWRRDGIRRSISLPPTALRSRPRRRSSLPGSEARRPAGHERRWLVRARGSPRPGADPSTCRTGCTVRASSAMITAATDRCNAINATRSAVVITVSSAVQPSRPRGRAPPASSTPDVAWPRCAPPDQHGPAVEAADGGGHGDVRSPDVLGVPTRRGRRRDSEIEAVLDDRPHDQSGRHPQPTVARRARRRCSDGTGPLSHLSERRSSSSPASPEGSSRRAVSARCGPDGPMTRCGLLGHTGARPSRR